MMFFPGVDDVSEAVLACVLLYAGGCLGSEGGKGIYITRIAVVALKPDVGGYGVTKGELSSCCVAGAEMDGCRLAVDDSRATGIFVEDADAEDAEIDSG